MSAKISAAKRAAFLKAVAETGNQTLAAERAKVSRSWVQLHRSTDPAFDAAVRAAVAEAKTVLRQAQDEREEGGNRPAGTWAYHQGEELVVRGTGGSRARNAGPDDPTGPRRVQIARARAKQWTARAERRFLAALARSCNVKAACAEVGLTPASAYNHARRWQHFARAWAEALAIGADKIDLAIIETGKNLFAGDDFDRAQPITGLRFGEAIQALRLHQKRLWGTGRRPGAAPTRLPPIEAVEAEILRKVALFERREARGRSGGKAGINAGCRHEEN